jgi:long-chain fatty acid transport protein
MKRASVYFVMSLLVCLFAVAATAQAGGFGLFEWGNAALGQGTAYYATGDDPSVIAYNPAQMTRLEGIQVYAGVTAISPNSDVNINGTKNSTSQQIFAVPHAYASYQVNDKLFIGVGEFTRFGLGTKYEDGWTGSTLLREAKLESFSFNPTIAYKVTDSLSIAGGLEIIKGSFYVTKQHVATGRPFNVDVGGTSLSGNIGLLYDFSDYFSVGFSYRAPVSFTGTGKAELDGLLPETNATVEATFPDQYSLGLGYQLTEDLSLEFDVVFTRWELFNDMTFDFQSAAYPDNIETFNYKNTWRFQLGTEYMATDNWALRAGYVFDQTPTRHAYASLMLPANDRHMFTLGTGYTFGNLTADLAGMYIFTKEREALTLFDGAVKRSVDYKQGQTWGLGLSLGYKF